MPLSFATILGGMVTLIGTPTNIVIAQFRGVATYRARPMGAAYSMFDFAPVGLVCALAGLTLHSTNRLAPHSSGCEPVIIRKRSRKSRRLRDGSQCARQIFGNRQEGRRTVSGRRRDTKSTFWASYAAANGCPAQLAVSRYARETFWSWKRTQESLEQFSNALKLAYSSSAKHKGVLTGTLAVDRGSGEIELAH